MNHKHRYATGVPYKVQGRDRVWIVIGSCGEVGPWGQYWGKNRFIEKSGVQAKRIVTWLNHAGPVPGSSDRPQQRYATGEPGKFHVRDDVGIIEGSCGYRARGVSIRG